MSKEAKTNRIILISVLSIMLILFIIANLFIYFYKAKCNDVTCFTTALASCNRANWIKEDSKASWLYTIKGMKNDVCKVNVKLLQIKSGTLVNQNLEGECNLQMTCFRIPKPTNAKLYKLLQAEISNEH